MRAVPDGDGGARLVAPAAGVVAAGDARDDPAAARALSEHVIAAASLVGGPGREQGGAPALPEAARAAVERAVRHGAGREDAVAVARRALGLEGAPLAITGHTNAHSIAVVVAKPPPAALVRAYVDQVVSKQLDEVVTELLSTLCYFQQRQRVKCARARLASCAAVACPARARAGSH